MTDKHAIEAAARAVWPTTQISEFTLHCLRDGIVAYLSALAEDEASVEACARAIDPVTYDNPKNYEDLSMRDEARAVLRTLATRAQGESS